MKQPIFSVRIRVWDTQDPVNKWAIKPIVFIVKGNIMLDDLTMEQALVHLVELEDFYIKKYPEFRVVCILSQRIQKRNTSVLKL